MCVGERERERDRMCVNLCVRARENVCVCLSVVCYLCVCVYVCRELWIPSTSIPTNGWPCKPIQHNTFTHCVHHENFVCVCVAGMSTRG